MKRQVPTGINLLGFVVSSICDIATWKTKKKSTNWATGIKPTKIGKRTTVQKSTKIKFAKSGLIHFTGLVVPSKCVASTPHAQGG